MDWLHAVFGTKDHLSALQECARAVLIFFYGLALVRIAGRRVFGKWAALDIVVSIIVGSNLSRIVTGNSPVVGTLLATTLLLAMHWFFAHLAARSPALSRLVEGRSIRIADLGRLDPAEAKRHAVTEADLGEALHQSGIERIEETRAITLEPSGKLTILKR